MEAFFKRIFKKKEEQPAPKIEVVQTAPLSEDQLGVVSKKESQHHPPQFLVGSAQSDGIQRDHNEDALYTFQTVLSDGAGAALPFGLFIVADGMGGHLHGEVASGVAIRAISEFLIERLYHSMMGLDPNPQSESLQEIIENGVREAQQAVLRRAAGGGTTLTAALLIGDQVTLAHVGDSRAYFIYPDGRMQLMTHDHSLVQRLVELGQLTEEQARTYPQKNVLYRAVGQLEPFRPDIITHLMPHPGTMMICSDGLWGVVSETDIFNIISSAPNPSEACHALIDAANEGGGPDNISAIVVQYLK